MYGLWDVCVQAVLVDHDKSVKKTQLLTDLVESKAQACEAAVAGQREASEKARNSAKAHDQAVIQLNVCPCLSPQPSVVIFIAWLATYLHCFSE